MKIKILFAILSLLLPLSVVHSQPTGTDEVIQRLKEVREKTKDLSATFSRKNNLLAETKDVSRGRFVTNFLTSFPLSFFSPSRA